MGGPRACVGICALAWPFPRFAVECSGWANKHIAFGGGGALRGSLEIIEISEHHSFILVRKRAITREKGLNSKPRHLHVFGLCLLCLKIGGELGSKKFGSDQY